MRKSTLISGLLLCGLWPDHSRAETTDQLSSLRNELAILKAMQAQIDARIAAVEQALDSLGTGPATAPTSAAQSSGKLSITSSVVPTEPERSPQGLDLSGDFRLRYETNSGGTDYRARHRGVLRARFRGRYAISDTLLLGAQLSTGDPDDPNTADITLSVFQTI